MCRGEPSYWVFIRQYKYGEMFCPSWLSGYGVCGVPTRDELDEGEADRLG